MIDPETIHSYPEAVKKEAQVKSTSKKGTITRHRIIMKERVQNTEENKGKK